MNEHFLDNRWLFPSFPHIKSTYVPFTDQLQLSSCCKWEETVKVHIAVEMQKRYLLIVLDSQKTTICNSNFYLHALIFPALCGSLLLNKCLRWRVKKDQISWLSRKNHHCSRCSRLTVQYWPTTRPPRPPLWPSCLRTWWWPQELITLPFEPTSGASQSPLEKHPIFLLLQHILKADITSPVKQHLRTRTSVTQIS